VNKYGKCPYISNMIVRGALILFAGLLLRKEEPAVSTEEPYQGISFEGYKITRLNDDEKEILESFEAVL
jgi:hypothetical protein